MRVNDLFMEGNSDKPNMAKVLEQPLNQGKQEEMTEIYDENDQIMDVEDEESKNIKNEQEEIMGVNERDETEVDDELGR